jgi:hypothetical protein
MVDWQVVIPHSVMLQKAGTKTAVTDFFEGAATNLGPLVMGKVA